MKNRNIKYWGNMAVKEVGISIMAALILMIYLIVLSRENITIGRIEKIFVVASFISLCLNSISKNRSVTLAISFGVTRKECEKAIIISDVVVVVLHILIIGVLHVLSLFSAGDLTDVKLIILFIAFLLMGDGIGQMFSEAPERNPRDIVFGLIGFAGLILVAAMMIIIAAGWVNDTIQSVYITIALVYYLAALVVTSHSVKRFAIG